MVSTSVRFFYGLCLLVAGLISSISPVMAAEVKVTVESETVSVNDSFTLLFQVGEGVKGRPDLSPLNRDFRIISTQQRSNVTIINGKPNSQSEWLLELMAKQTGELTIPSIAFGTTKTPEMTITVVEGQNSASQTQDDDVFVEVEVNTDRSWVQAQIIYTIRLFRAVTTVNSRLSEPTSSYGQMFMEKLEDRQFETFRNNKRYAVLQRRYALFPQSSGEITIEPISFQGQITQRSRSLFDSFGKNSRAVQRFSRPIKLTIQAVPADFTGDNWLPAENVQLHEKWLKDDLTLVAGEPATRTIVLRAEGLMSAQLPEIGAPDVPGIRQYPEQPELTNQHSQDGILGVREEKSAVIANAAGDYVLPAVTIPWFNTKTGQMEEAVLPERVINAKSDPNAPAVNETPTQTISNNSDASDEPQNALNSGSSAYWPWLSLLLGLGWGITAYLWWRDRHVSGTRSVSRQPSSSINKRQALIALRNVLSRDVDTQTAKNALLNWASAIWPEQPPASLGAISLRVDDELRTAVDKLNAALYQNDHTDSPNAWDREKLLIAVENFDAASDAQSQNNALEGRLEPLNKLG